MKKIFSVLTILTVFPVITLAESAEIIGTCTVASYERGVSGDGQFLSIVCSNNGNVFYYYSTDAFFPNNNLEDLGAYEQTVAFAHINNKQVMFDWYTSPEGVKKFMWVKIKE